MNKKDKHLKTHNLLLDQYEQLKSEKSKLTKFISEKDKKLKYKSSRDVKLIRIIKLYISSKDSMMKTSLKAAVESLREMHNEIDVIVKMSESTFQREVAHYKKMEL
ncbi:MAG: hypothetical protein KAG14_01485 [Mycoplasmataceae bacterium]|nr:hypothetical protein [Mycoplasmataceae bacterium]